MHTTKAGAVLMMSPWGGKVRCSVECQTRYLFRLGVKRLAVGPGRKSFEQCPCACFCGDALLRNLGPRYVSPVSGAFSLGRHGLLLQRTRDQSRLQFALAQRNGRRSRVVYTALESRRVWSNKTDAYLFLRQTSWAHMPSGPLPWWSALLLKPPASRKTRRESPVT